eukprot:7309115-Alexandrium_andersonii.AAC.1
MAPEVALQLPLGSPAIRRARVVEVERGRPGACVGSGLVVGHFLENRRHRLPRRLGRREHGLRLVGQAGAALRRPLGRGGRRAFSRRRLDRCNHAPRCGASVSRSRRR